MCALKTPITCQALFYKRGLWRDWPPPPNQVTSTCRHQASHVECIVGRLIEDFDWTTSRYFSCASSPGHEITRKNVPVTFSPWWKSARSQGCPLHVSGVGTVISCIREHMGTTDLASTHPAPVFWTGSSSKKLPFRQAYVLVKILKMNFWGDIKISFSDKAQIQIVF